MERPRLSRRLQGETQTVGKKNKDVELPLIWAKSLKVLQKMLQNN